MRSVSRFNLNTIKKQNCAFIGRTFASLHFQLMRKEVDVKKTFADTVNLFDCFNLSSVVYSKHFQRVHCKTTQTNAHGIASGKKTASVQDVHTMPPMPTGSFVRAVSVGASGGAESLGNAREQRSERDWSGARRLRPIVGVYLQFVNGDPRVGGEVLQHRHEELQAAVPVADQQHQTDEVEDAHEHPGDAEELKETDGVRSK